MISMRADTDCIARRLRVGSYGSEVATTRRRNIADHQRLAIADEYVHRVVVGLDHADVHMRRQLVDHAIALVEQVVRRLAGLRLAVGDLIVQLGDAAAPAT